MAEPEDLISRHPTLSKRFEILRVIGTGAAGAVYQARDLQSGGREVAIKVLTNKRAFDDETMTRFEEELRVSSEIHHPNLVEAYELIDDGSVLAFIMEYVDGSDLARVFSKRKFSEEQIDAIFDQLLSAVIELHSKGVLHRDIKLENILLSRDGTIKLSDFGLVKQYNKEVTAVGVILGTAHYFPPEYVKEGKYDARSEVYALGTLLFEMVTGERWLKNLNGKQALDYLIKHDFKFPLESLIDISPRFRRLLERCLGVNARDRFQSVAELKSAFNSVITPNKTYGDRHLLEPKVSMDRFRPADKKDPRSESYFKIILFLIWLCAVVSLCALIYGGVKDRAWWRGAVRRVSEDFQELKSKLPLRLRSSSRE